MVSKGHITSMQDIFRINEVASKQYFEIFISSGNQMYDAKSFVCLFNLIGKDVNIIAEDNIDNKIFAKVIKKMRIS